jgi:hypothetical protein
MLRYLNCLSRAPPPNRRRTRQPSSYTSIRRHTRAMETDVQMFKGADKRQADCVREAGA